MIAIFHPPRADEPAGDLRPRGTLGRKRREVRRRRHVPGHAHGGPRTRYVPGAVIEVPAYGSCGYGDRQRIAIATGSRWLQTLGPTECVGRCSRVIDTAGGEFKAAMEEARAVRARIVFGDRPVDVTSDRIAARIGIKVGSRLTLVCRPTCSLPRQQARSARSGARSSDTAVAQRVTAFEQRPGFCACSYRTQILQYHWTAGHLCSETVLEASAQEWVLLLHCRTSSDSSQRRRPQPRRSRRKRATAASRPQPAAVPGSSGSRVWRDTWRRSKRARRRRRCATACGRSTRGLRRSSWTSETRCLFLTFCPII